MTFHRIIHATKRWLSTLPNHRKRQLQAVARVLLGLVPHKHDLTLLSIKYGGDKLQHGYIPHYQRLFGPIRKRRLTVLEIGIGGFDDPSSGGESLRMWKDFFPRSMVVGIDIVDKRGLEEARIKTFRGDQSNAEFLLSVITEVGRPDIIIDDGSHQNPHVLASFRTLFAHLADGGTYVVEDLYTSYWTRMGGAWDNGAERDTSMSMLKDLADAVNCKYIPLREATAADGCVTSVQFFPKIAFVQKGVVGLEEPAHLIADLRREEDLRRSAKTGNVRA